MNYTICQLCRATFVENPIVALWEHWKDQPRLKAEALGKRPKRRRKQFRAAIKANHILVL